MKKATTVTKIIAPQPPRDGREWDAQCARCGSSTIWYDCDNCGGEGFIESDDWQDDEDTLYTCDWCRGTCGHMVCCSTDTYCEGHPREGRVEVKRGAIEWFTFDSKEPQ